MAQKYWSDHYTDRCATLTIHLVHKIGQANYALPDNMKAGTMLLANYSSHENSSTILHLKGWESRIYKQ